MWKDETENGKQLHAALETLETNLETPLVPGELPAWTSAVQRGLTEVGVRLRRQIDDAHRRQYDEMREQDPGLMTRIEQLEHEDAQLLERFDKLSEQTSQLANRAELAEPDEVTQQNRVDQLVEQGLAFVIEVRKHKAALTTWYVEAFTRDRGDVD